MLPSFTCEPNVNRNRLGAGVIVNDRAPRKAQRLGGLCCGQAVAFHPCVELFRRPRLSRLFLAKAVERIDRNANVAGPGCAMPPFRNTDFSEEGRFS